MAIVPLRRSEERRWHSAAAIRAAICEIISIECLNLGWSLAVKSLAVFGHTWT
jgi:hypothetical protein